MKNLSDSTFAKDFVGTGTLCGRYYHRYSHSVKQSSASAGRVHTSQEAFLAEKSWLAGNVRRGNYRPMGIISRAVLHFTSPWSQGGKARIQDSTVYDLPAARPPPCCPIRREYSMGRVQ